MRGKHAKTKARKNIVYHIFLMLSLIIMIVCIIYIILWIKDSKHNSNLMEEVKKISIEGNEGDNTDETINFKKLKEYNNDIVGWLKVNNTQIDYPVVKYSDNSFYLNHSIDKTYNSQGWIFIDYNVRLDGDDKNITIYGHNVKDGSMFGTLKNVLKKEWCEEEENLYISYITEKGEETYKVFSVYQVEKEVYYITNYFSNNEEFKDFLGVLKSRSIFDFNTDVGEDDKIITLSTCATNDNYRVVLHAKKIEND